MAKTKSNKAPVSTRVVNGKVQLSKSRLATLALITDVKARQELQSAWEAKALESAEKNAVFQARRSQFDILASDDNKFVYVNGVGGRRGCVMSKAGALKLIEEIELFKETVDGLDE